MSFFISALPALQWFRAGYCAYAAVPFLIPLRLNFRFPFDFPVLYGFGFEGDNQIAFERALKGVLLL